MKMATGFRARSYVDNGDDDDDEEFFHHESPSLIENQPLLPPLSQPLPSAQSAELRSPPPSATEYEPDTKVKKNSKDKHKTIPKVVQNMFSVPPHFTAEYLATCLSKVQKARSRDMNIANHNVRALCASTKYGRAPAEGQKKLEEETRAATLAKRMQNGTHFTVVAEKLGLILKKEEKRPTLEPAADDEKDFLAPTTTKGGSTPEKVSVGLARKRSIDAVLPKDELNKFNERPRKVVRSSWTNEWESLEFSFDVLYRDAQERHQGIREDESEDGDGPTTDAFKKSESALNEMLRAPSIKIEESAGKETNEKGEKSREKGEKREKEGEVEKREEREQEVTEKGIGRKWVQIKTEPIG